MSASSPDRAKIEARQKDLAGQSMEHGQEATMDTLSHTIEFVLWGITCVGLLLGLLLRIGEAMQHLSVWLRRRRAPPGRPQARPISRLAVGILLGGMMALPTTTLAAQGWWWGSPITPGFDPQTVIQVTGTVTQVDIGGRGGPSTVRLESSEESFAVMLGPGWFLAELKADIRNGDSLTVEGSKMMDRRQQVHLVAARITNHRTGSVVVLRDEKGRPRWMGGPGPGRKS
jgi:hypothetical protein